MNVWENYTRRVVCVVCVLWPLAIHADGFDGYVVTDQAEQLVSVASDLESKPRADLVGESILVQPEEVLGELFDANPTLDMGMASDEALGFDGDEGSNAPFLAASSGSPSGSYQEDADTSYCVDSGAFNRILGDACPHALAGCHCQSAAACQCRRRNRFGCQSGSDDHVGRPAVCIIPQSGSVLLH